MYNITLVSAIIELPHTSHYNRTREFRIDHFVDIASTGVPIYVFTCAAYKDIVQSISDKYQNIHIADIIDINDTIISKMTPVDASLPEYRNGEKDIREYMLLMNSKIEFVNRIAKLNPENTEFFGWIDFSISYIFRNKLQTLNYINTLAKRHLQKPMMTIPGCWAYISDDISTYLSKINWRFCGGFFIGDSSSIHTFYSLYEKYYPVFMEEYGNRLVWEVNFWAWLDWKHGDEWLHTWYSADHNDSIVRIPPIFYYCALSSFPGYTLSTYSYPTILDYTPSSASFITYRGQNILNTRYVNYIILPSGNYHFNNQDHNLISYNVMTYINNIYEPYNDNYILINNPNNIEYNMAIQGFEDVRLFIFKDAIWFVASNRNYIESGKTRIVYGKYGCAENNYMFTNIIAIEPPSSNSYCEKNWIPITTINGDGQESLCFIYKWFPFQIGFVNDTNTLVINKCIPSADIPIFFEHIRGSTIFINYTDGLSYGVVHYCEDTMPRRYYHVIVAIDMKTLEPIKYSQSFVFDKIGIEFCIGMAIDIISESYIFWISRHDRDSAMVSIPIKYIPCIFDFSLASPSAEHNSKCNCT